MVSYDRNTENRPQELFKNIGVVYTCKAECDFQTYWYFSVNLIDNIDKSSPIFALVSSLCVSHVW